MSGVLERILASKRAEVATLRARGERPNPRVPARGVPAALRRARELRLIAEIKFRSPSAGELSREMDAGERALAYARSGAAMVSVLCDEPFFGGSYDHVTKARAALDAAGLAVPILAKEFVLDDVQVARAREVGADAVLLIVRIAPEASLAGLVAACRARSLEPFVEVATEAELEVALRAGARVIGVNARDLDTLEMDSERAARVLASIPSPIVAVHLSGLRTPDDVEACARGRADAALVGEALMRAGDPGNLLKRLLAKARK